MKTKIIVFAFTLFGAMQIQAQDTTLPTGGVATGAGGSSSYSIGQVVYTTTAGTNGSVVQGVQQPYEISVITGINNKDINLDLAVYPNPTTNYLQLKVEKLESLTYQLIDLQGKVIENKKVTATISTIKMEALPKAIYLLNVRENNQLVKTFKVIKN